MSGPDDGNDDPFHSSGHPNEPDPPGEDNAGERLIRKYDPTIDEDSNAETGSEPDFGDVNVDNETAQLFWYLVLVFNVALMALAIGLMLIVFLDRWVLGGQITIAGAILTAYGYYRYRKHAHSSDEAEDETEDTDEAETEAKTEAENETGHERVDEAESHRSGPDDGNG